MPMPLLVLVLRNPPRTLPGICAVLALLFGLSAMALYCYGWFSVALGGPFPELCEDENGSGSRLADLAQDFWPLRNACVYSDGSTVEHLSPSINVLVHVQVVLAVVLTCAAVFLYRRARRLRARTT
ncbi:hypothetical protein ACIRO3_32155 [Streptomyces sp. NPDC102278]|uniref:hypothetical protein n=1 Tax=Streptomyces sp. NPDC102278 TaxID=3366152 RepID=UPI0037F229CA